MIIFNFCVKKNTSFKNVTTPKILSLFHQYSQDLSNNFTDLYTFGVPLHMTIWLELLWMCGWCQIKTVTIYQVKQFAKNTYLCFLKNGICFLNSNVNRDSMFLLSFVPYKFYTSTKVDFDNEHISNNVTQIEENLSPPSSPACAFSLQISNYILTSGYITVTA